MRKQIRIGQLFAYLGLLIAAAIMIFPLIYAISTSLMSRAEVSTFPPLLWSPHPTLDNYRELFRTVPVWRWLLNSLLVSALVTLGQILTASLSGFTFGTMSFKGKAAVFALFMSTMMVPWEVTMIPNYLTIRSLNWVDKYPALVVPFLATAFGTFLLRQFFMQIPRDLEEAARIDGCSRIRYFWSIALPLARPGLITLGSYTFLSTWNQYLWPLLATNTRTMRTVQIGVRFLMNEEGLQMNRVMAGVSFFMIPAAIMLLVGQRYLVRGLMTGAVKG
ncbi:MAG: carbohydrate ABC transporter permease [Mycobacterium leprae]